MRRIKKISLVICVAIFALVALCLVQYAFTPIKTMRTLTGDGCLLMESGSGQDARIVPVKMEGRLNHYLFHNQNDWFFGSCQVNGSDIYEDDELFAIYFDDAEHSGDSYGFKYATEDLKAFIFGIEDVSHILTALDARPPEDKQAGLLVFPAKDADTALDMIKEAAAKEDVSGIRGLKKWMESHDFSF